MNTTKEYYSSLSEDDINDTILILKFAIEDNRLDFFKLLMSDIFKYISVLEYYKHDDKPDFPLIIKRINNNLFIKFQLYPETPWIETGFHDLDITDYQTISELKTNIKFYIENSNKLLLKKEDILKCSNLDNLNKTLVDASVQVPPSPQLTSTEKSNENSNENPNSNLICKRYLKYEDVNLTQLIYRYIKSINNKNYNSGIYYNMIGSYISKLNPDILILHMLSLYEPLKESEYNQELEYLIYNYINSLYNNDIKVGLYYKHIESYLSKISLDDIIMYLINLIN